MKQGNIADAEHRLRHKTVSCNIAFGGETSRWVYIHGVCNVYTMYMLGICFVYTCTELIMLTAGLFGNYPSLSILHWRA